MKRQLALIGIIVSMLYGSSALAAADFFVIPINVNAAKNFQSVYKFDGRSATVTIELLSLPSDKGFILTSLDFFCGRADYEGDTSVTFYVYESITSNNTTKFTYRQFPTLSAGRTSKAFVPGISFAKGSKIMLECYVIGGGGDQGRQILMQGYYF